MAFNGSGTFNLYTPGNPTVTGTTISSTWANNTLSDIATGLSTCVTKDGQTTTTAVVPFADGLSSAALVDISGASAGQIKFPSTQNASSNAHTLDDYSEGSFTGTLTGVGGTVNVTVTYTKIGNYVNLVVPDLTGTSNATSKTMTGLPAALTPASTKTAFVRCSDNGGTYAAGYASLTGTTVTFLPTVAAANSATWTNSGTADIQPFQMSYTLA